MRTDVWGIDAGYEDALGVWQPTPPPPLSEVGF